MNKGGKKVTLFYSWIFSSSSAFEQAAALSVFGRKEQDQEAGREHSRSEKKKLFTRGVDLLRSRSLSF